MAVFAGDCAVRAVITGALLAIATVTTTAEAEQALRIRVLFAILVLVTWVWSLSLISGNLGRPFAWTITFLSLILFFLHVFVIPFQPIVTSVIPYVLPWGETISNLRLGRVSLWIRPVYVFAIAIELFGLYCGCRCWMRDRLTGSLVLVATAAMLALHGMQILRIIGILELPFLGMIGHMIWACMIGVVIGRQHFQTQQQLAISEQRFRGIFDQTFQLIWLIGTDGTVIQANQTALEVLAGRGKTVIGQPFWTTSWWSHSPDVRDRLRQAIKDAAEGRIVRLEVTYLRSDGKLAHLDFSLKPVRNEHGEITLLIPEGRDITDRMQAEELLWDSRQRLEVLSRQLISTQETERRHLARELHDEIGQVLTAIKMNLRRAQREVDSGTRPDWEDNVEMVERAIIQVRNLSLSLRPPQLDELGLVAALHWLVKHQARLGGFEDHLDVDLGDVRIPVELETVCFRIAQEALTNAIRHGMPRSVRVKLQASSHELSLSIQDDGIGFDVSDSRRRAMDGDNFGLISMQERSSLVGGQVQIESTPGRGTRVHVSFPL